MRGFLRLWMASLGQDFQCLDRGLRYIRIGVGYQALQLRNCLGIANSAEKIGYISSDAGIGIGKHCQQGRDQVLNHTWPIDQSLFKHYKRIQPL